MGLVGLARCRVLADDVGGREILTLHRLEHLGEGPAVLRGDRHAPGRLESRTRLGVLFDVLEPGELVGDGAHVAAPLHVVLAAEGVHAAAVDPHVAGEQREIDERDHIVHGVVVLGDAQRPTDHGAIGLGVAVRDLADDLARNARDLLTALQGPVHDRILVFVEPERRPFDEGVVLEVVDDDLARDRVAQPDVGTDVDAQPQVAPLGRLGAPRIDHHHLGTVVDPLEGVVEEDRMRRSRIRSPEEDQIGVLDLLV